MSSPTLCRLNYYPFSFGDGVVLFLEVGGVGIAYIFVVCFKPYQIANGLIA